MKYTEQSPERLHRSSEDIGRWCDWQLEWFPPFSEVGTVVSCALEQNHLGSHHAVIQSNDHRGTAWLRVAVEWVDDPVWRERAEGLDLELRRSEAADRALMAADRDGRIHSFLGMVGADWLWSSVIDAINEATEIEWHPEDVFHHELWVTVPDKDRTRTYCFDVKAPQ